MSNEAVQCLIEGPVAKLILNRPDKRNAINDEIINQLQNHLDELALNEDVRVITLSGNGPCFSAGIDLAYIGSLASVDDKQRGTFLREMARKIQNIMIRMENIEKPIVAVIHRYCVGLGMELVLGCDFRIATPDVLFSLPEIHLGLIPDCGGTTRLTRLVGIAKAKEMIMLGDSISIEEAKAMNLVTTIADADKLAEEADALVQRLLARPSLGMGLIKRMVQFSSSVDQATSFELEPLLQTCLVMAPDFGEIMMSGFQSLQEKRKSKE